MRIHVHTHTKHTNLRRVYGTQTIDAMLEKDAIGYRPCYVVLMMVNSPNSLVDFSSLLYRATRLQHKPLIRVRACLCACGVKCAQRAHANLTHFQYEMHATIAQWSARVRRLFIVLSRAVAKKHRANSNCIHTRNTRYTKILELCSRPPNQPSTIGIGCCVTPLYMLRNINNRAERHSDGTYSNGV